VYCEALPFFVALEIWETQWTNSLFHLLLLLLPHNKWLLSVSTISAYRKHWDVQTINFVFICLCAALSNRVFRVKSGIALCFHYSATTHSNQRSAFGTSSATDITFLIYKFEVPKVADSRLLACDAEVLIWCSPVFWRTALPSSSTLEDEGDIHRTVSFSFWNAPALAVSNGTQLLVLEELLQCINNDPVPCLVSNPWHRTCETRLWTCTM
jgi:hypothetical protein